MKLITQILKLNFYFVLGEASDDDEKTKIIKYPWTSKKYFRMFNFEVYYTNCFWKEKFRYLGNFRCI